MIWWYWMLIGLVLLGAEMVTPGGLLYSLLWARGPRGWHPGRGGTRPGGMAPVAVVFRSRDYFIAGVSWTVVGLDQNP